MLFWILLSAFFYLCGAYQTFFHLDEFDHRSERPLNFVLSIFWFLFCIGSLIENINQKNEQ